MKKSMRLKHRLKKLSTAQKKIEDRNPAKNGMHRPLAYVYIEILEIPLQTFVSPGVIE
ncbi:MAG TPA: hypothetical protein VN368_00490 [Candidatus Methylomirabilis sp.]|nr:hypothetical protein [Candidatus Methylomirabilis sp.]